MQSYGAAIEHLNKDSTEEQLSEIRTQTSISSSQDCDRFCRAMNVLRLPITHTAQRQRCTYIVGACLKDSTVSVLPMNNTKALGSAPQNYSLKRIKNNALG